MSITDPFHRERRFTQRAAEVTQHEVQAARQLLQDYGLARPSLAAAIAAALADARDGATIPGERLEVQVHVFVSGRLWRQTLVRGDLETSARARLRREWAAKLDREGLRPLTWPAPEVTFQRWRAMDGTEAPPTVSAPFTDCESQDADQVTFTLRGLAVVL